MIEGMIFDLDGTLLNTLPLCMEAFRLAFVRFTGEKYSDETIASFFGPSEEGVIKKAAPQNYKACLEYYLEQYKLLHTNKNLIFPGIIPIIKLLEQYNIPKAIVSGKGKKSMQISLEHSGLSSYFSEIYTGNAEGIRKAEHLDKILQEWKKSRSKVYYAGDSVSDILAARTAGIQSIAALWGNNTVHQNSVLKQNPDLYFYSTREFKQWLDKKLSPIIKGKKAP